MPHLVEILLPLADNAGRAFAAEDYARVRDELTEAFGGVTTFSRAPAEGFWKQADGAVDRDRVVVFEVMVEELDGTWWSAYRRRLAERFRQEELVMRATRFERL